MKKFTLFLAALCCCAMMNAETYGLSVGGVQVTSDNASNILGNNTASYDASTNTLTLNNASITMNGKGAIIAAGALRIEVVGNNYIAINNPTEYGSSAIQTMGELVIFAPLDATSFSKLQIVCGISPALYTLSGDIKLSYLVNIDIKGGTGTYGCIKAMSGNLYVTGAGLSMLPGWIRVNNIYLSSGRSEISSPSDAIVSGGKIIRSGTSSEYSSTQQVVIASLYRKLTLGVDPKTSPNVAHIQCSSLGDMDITGQKTVFVCRDEELKLSVASVDDNYEFDSWWKVTSSGSKMVWDEPKTTYTMDDNTSVLYAKFNKKYDLNVVVSAAMCGNIAICNDEPTEQLLTKHYIAETPIELKAIAGYGYEFVGWATSHDGTPFSTENPYNTTKKAANEEIYAQFETVSVEDKVSKGVFTIGQNKYARLATGNLQYQPFTGKWRFAFEEYDAIGDANKDISSTSLEWFDLFGWGTGNNPAKTSTSDPAYADYHEWGDNPIVNGGNKAKQWRTPTELEWRYIFAARPNAATKWALANIEDQLPGIILIPDNFDYPSLNTNHNSFNDNLFTTTDIRWLEQQGVIFLPVTGYREGTNIFNATSKAWYWTADPEKDIYGHYMTFTAAGHAYAYGPRHRGQAVRLIQEVENPQGVEDVNVNAKAVKVIKDGQLLIEKNGKTYNALGAEVQ